MNDTANKFCFPEKKRMARESPKVLYSILLVPNRHAPEYYPCYQVRARLLSVLPGPRPNIIRATRPRPPIIRATRPAPKYYPCYLPGPRPNIILLAGPRLPIIRASRPAPAYYPCYQARARLLSVLSGPRPPIIRASRSAPAYYPCQQALPNIIHATRPHATLYHRWLSGALPPRYGVQYVKLTTHIHVVPRLRTRGLMPVISKLPTSQAYFTPN
jgi:hypothetical protein